jgi:RND family efflux transporter MFP subunit
MNSSTFTRATAACLAATAVLAFSCGGGGEAKRPSSHGEPLPVRAVEVASAAWTGGSVVSATVQAVRQAGPGTVLMGRVDRIVHREGDRVRAGAVLARIESREVVARVAQAEAGVAAARANEENARLMKERMVRLLAKDAAPRKGLDDAVAGYEAARAGRAAAEEAVAAARMYESYANVTAPFDGVVTSRRVEAGDMVAPGMPLFTVEDLSRMKVEAQIPESRLAGLGPGASVEVDVPGAGGGRSATVDAVLPAADPVTRTFTVRVVLDNSDGALRSGMFARLRLPSSGEAAPVVPRGSLVRSGPLTGVFVVEQGVARLRWLSLGEERGDEVRVLAGLRAGERVVADPPASLEDGRAVEVR